MRKKVADIAVEKIIEKIDLRCGWKYGWKIIRESETMDKKVVKNRWNKYSINFGEKGVENE